MKRNSHPRGEKFRDKILNKCCYCHKTGLKPGILETKLGDYGVRDRYKNEEELQLNESGFCKSCSHDNR